MPNKSQTVYPAVGAGPKVPIPRLERPDREQDPARWQEKSRVVSACTACRKRKVKCTGERPKCKNCEDNTAPCEYVQVRKDRLKVATDYNTELVQLLKDISPRVSDSDRRKIEQLLNLDEDDATASPSVSSNTNAHGKRPRLEDIPSDGEATSPAVEGRAASDDDVEWLDEDLLRSRESRATGFVGQNSEVQWLRSLRNQMKGLRLDQHQMPYGPPGTAEESKRDRESAFRVRREGSRPIAASHVADSTYYPDGDGIDIDLNVDPQEMPSPEVAEKLFECYMSTIHRSFPILPRSFEVQFRKFCDSIKSRSPLAVTAKWRAILNLVFAIGSKYSHLVNAEWEADDCNHLKYLGRALRLLELNNVVMIISIPDLPAIQASGLLSLYYLAIGHVSRAWIMIGVALRFALAVGLHLRNEDLSAPVHKKESLVRIWWGLHCVESLLCAMTGRPCVVGDEDCTVPLPILLPEEIKAASFKMDRQLRWGTDVHFKIYGPPSLTPSSSTDSDSSRHRLVPPNPGSFIDARVRISRISQKVLSVLYSPRAPASSWHRIQKSIASLLAELDEWANVALPDISAENQTPGLDLEQQRDRVLLSFHYYSERILVTRPCLCRIERRIQGQRNESASFNQSTAEACVEAAKGMTTLLPDQPDTGYIYKTGPWWAIVHHIMQAIAVLLLDLSYYTTHSRQPKNAEMIEHVKKLMRWLHAMRTNNSIAERALQVVLDIVKGSTPHLKAELFDFLTTEGLSPTTQAQHSHPAASAAAESGYTTAPYSGTEFEPGGWDHGDWGNPNVNLQPHLNTSYFTKSFTSPTSAGHAQELPQPQPQPPFDSSYLEMLSDYQLHMLGSDQTQIPLAFNNPFLTSFDQPNPLYSTLSIDEDGTDGYKEPD